ALARREAMVDAQSYWTDRMRRGDITAVGRLGLSARLNRALYDLAEHNVSRVIKRHHLLPVPRALDVGTGWGAWVDFWHRARVPHVDAIDFSEASIARVSERWAGGGEYRVGDVAAPGAFAGMGPYPLVSCMNVLLHVLEEEAFRVARANLAK